MPIKPIVLQRRHAELGRIRLGYKAPTSKGTRPAKLEKFRFTSASERYIRDLAELYGGEARPWDNSGKAEWEVYTDATTIPVIAVKGGLSQWMETWSGGGCIHRCDGEVNVLTGEYCEDDQQTVTINGKPVRAHDAAKPTTRLSVMLPELEAIGAWRLESKGWNAAAEIPAVAELAQYVGDLVPAHLNLVERRAVKDGKTSRFVVPVLDLQIGTARLREIVAQVSSGTTALDAPAPARAALEAGPTAAPAQEALPDYRAIADAATELGQVQALWRQASEAGHLDDDLRGYLMAKGNALQAAANEGPVDAEVVEHDTPATDPATAPAPAGADDPDLMWGLIVKECGELGATLPEVIADFEQRMALAPGEASAGEMQAYLQLVREQGIDLGEAVPA